MLITARFGFTTLCKPTIVHRRDVENHVLMNYTWFRMSDIKIYCTAFFALQTFCFIVPPFFWLKQSPLKLRVDMTSAISWILSGQCKQLKQKKTDYAHAAHAQSWDHDSAINSHPWLQHVGISRDSWRNIQLYLGSNPKNPLQIADERWDWYRISNWWNS